MYQFYIRADDRYSMQVESNQTLASVVRARVNEIYKTEDGDFYMVANNRVIRDNMTLEKCNVGPDSTININWRLRGCGPCPGCNNPAVRVYLIDSAGNERLTLLDNNQALVSTLRQKIGALLRESQEKFRIVSETGILQNHRTVASYGVEKIATVAIDSRMTAVNGCSTFVFTAQGPFENLEKMDQARRLTEGELTQRSIPRTKYGKRNRNRSEKSVSHAKRPRSS